MKGKIVTFKKAVEMIAEPLKACFDLNGNIWCTTDSEVQPLEVILAGKDYVLATNASKELAGVKIDSNLISKGIRKSKSQTQQTFTRLENYANGLSGNQTLNQRQLLKKERYLKNLVKRKSQREVGRNEKIIERRYNK